MKPVLVLLLFSFLFWSTTKAQLQARMIRDSAIDIKSTFNLSETEKNEAMKNAVAGDSTANDYFFKMNIVAYKPGTTDWQIIKGHTITERLKKTWFIDINHDGLPDIIHSDFNIKKDEYVTYVYMNIGMGYKKLLYTSGIPNYMQFDKKGNLERLGIYRHFCCDHSFDYIYSYKVDFRVNHVDKIFKLVDIWYTIHYFKDKPDSFDNQAKTIKLKKGIDLPSYYPNAIPFQKGEAMDAMVYGRIGLDKNTRIKILATLKTQNGNRYFIEAPFPKSIREYSKYKDKGDIPTKIIGWVTENELNN